MKLKFRLLLVTSIATIAQVANLAPAHADSTQIGRLVAQPSLLNSIVERKPIAVSAAQNVADIPTAKDLVAANRKTRKKKIVPRQQPSKKPAATTPTSQTPTTPAANQKQVLVSDIVVKSPTGTLAPELESKIRQVLTVKTGQPTTREQLEQNLNAVRALGAFSTVEIVPEDTNKGVKLSVLVTPYGALQQVQIQTLPANSSTVLKQADIDALFQNQYGKPLNSVEVQAAIVQLNALYQKQGYNLAQVVEVKEPTSDGKLVLVIAEGLIEDVQVRFINKEGSLVDDKQQPFKGLTRPFIVTREAELKPGKIFNRQTIQKDLQRIYGLGIFDDVRVSFAPGTDPAKVVLQFNVVEKKTSSIVAGGGLSSANGLFASVGYNQLNVGGNAQTIGANLQLGTTGFLGDLSFTDPWIATDPNRTSYTTNIFSRRSTSLIFGGGTTPQYVPNSIPSGSTTGDTPTIVRQGGGITFYRPLNGDPYTDSPWRASLGLQYQRVSVQNFNSGNSLANGTLVPQIGGRNLTASGTGEDDLLMVQLGLTQDLRNSATDPSQGSLLKLGLDQSAPIGLGNIAMTRARASYTQYVPVKLTNFTPGSQSLMFNVQGGTILGTLPPYEAFSLGGPTSVRGYEEGDIGSGRSYFQATAEYRFPIVSIVGGEIFFDYGSDLGTGSSVPGDPAGLRGKPGNGFGYGAGIRIGVPALGSIRLDYAVNNLSQSRIQFGIGERF
ncbi:BamA/TamA family outer membrane protein [Chamaesiphon sp. VAR_69_metabat_338]|uniref:BamA/TamA family outer membrane protein n=1 Tax=Chamaesiphon sp. VAR_69_metabat_338 TaxID=2964704 RepID=UPI00286D72F2|nr:BamA/TamA family outer membrane protein [Chamaesiphon sp. VAR_69_metabat_338]